jgi:Zn-dependent protease
MPAFDFAASLNRFAVAFAPALLGIILHETAHGWMAGLRGDPTARLAGRLTLNPVRHIDPLGLLVFVFTSISGPFVFGWARPVPVNPRYFRNPSKDMMLVALAGPLVNMLLALACAALLRLTLDILPREAWREGAGRFALLSLHTGVVINFGLAWLNLMPIPPLDGSRFLAWLLPGKLAARFYGLERYGLLILIILLATNTLGFILTPLIVTSAELALSLVGIG